jgi:hypothetical protein
VLHHYKQTWRPRHPKASTSGCVNEHILIAESALGKYLPTGAEVHHIDQNRRNNSNANLVICENREYHRLLHTRTQAYYSTGDATKRQCWVCKTWDFVDIVPPNRTGKGWAHPACRSKQQKERRAKETEEQRRKRLSYNTAYDRIIRKGAEGELVYQGGQWKLP